MLKIKKQLPLQINEYEKNVQKLVAWVCPCHAHGPERPNLQPWHPRKQVNHDHLESDLYPHAASHPAFQPTPEPAPEDEHHPGGTS